MVKRHKKAHRKPVHKSVKPVQIPPAKLRCAWCGNLVTAHTRELLASCRNHTRQPCVVA